MEQTNIFHVRPEQVGSEDISEFLRRAINKEFEGKDYYIGQELSLERVTHYSPTSKRRLRGFCICESGKPNQTIYFDVTEVPQINWIGR
jgi:hypothetical protein